MHTCNMEAGAVVLLGCHVPREGANATPNPPPPRCDRLQLPPLGELRAAVVSLGAHGGADASWHLDSLDLLEEAGGRAWHFAGAVFPCGLCGAAAGGRACGAAAGMLSRAEPTACRA